MTIQRLREREVDSKVQVSEAEVDNYLATVAAQAGGESEYQLSHIMVGVPEQATPDQIDARQRRAEEALAQVKGGNDFKRGGRAVFRRAGRDAGRRPRLAHAGAAADRVRDGRCKDMKKGEVSPVLRSPGGFHIVKLNDSRSRNAPTVVEQTHVRHILVRVNESTSESEAKAKIERIQATASTPAASSPTRRSSTPRTRRRPRAATWAGSIPGDTVPEFEQAMNKLKINEVSAPVRSPFGWHLIVVEERRTQDVTQDAQARPCAQRHSRAQGRRAVLRVHAPGARQGVRGIQDSTRSSAFKGVREVRGDLRAFSLFGRMATRAMQWLARAGAPPARAINTRFA